MSTDRKSSCIRNGLLQHITCHASAATSTHTSSDTAFHYCMSLVMCPRSDTVIVGHINRFCYLLFNVRPRSLPARRLHRCRTSAAGSAPVLCLTYECETTFTYLARVVCQRGGRTGAAPLLQSLHWLPVQHCITCKTAVLTHKVLTTSAPSYVSDMLHTASPANQLRSAAAPLLVVPCTRTDIVGCAFSVAATSVWNSLPANIRLCNTTTTFIQHLKTLLFRQM